MYFLPFRVAALRPQEQVESLSPPVLVLLGASVAAFLIAVLSLLAYPVALAPVVAQDGALGDFASQELRALGESVVAAVHDGLDVVPATFLGAVQDPRLRRLLESGMAGNDAALDQTAQHLMRLLDKVKLEARRRRVRSTYVQGQVSPADEAEQRAFEEEQRRLLEESRELHRRIRERENRG
jgi:hypothetical protein